MAINVQYVPRTPLTLQYLPRIPARLSGSGGITVEQAGDLFTVKPAFENLAVLTIGIADNQFWIYNPITDVYSRTTFQAILDAIALGTMAASSVEFTPAGTIAATNVQSAIEELDAEKQPLDADLTTLAGLARARGDIIRGGASAWERHALGATSSILKSDGTDVVYTTLTALLDAAFGSAQGSVLYRGASVWDDLGPGTSGQFLKTQGAAANPIWDAIPGGGDMLAANNLSDVVSAATSFGNIKQAASTTATGVVEKATQAEMEAATADKFPDASILHFAPDVAKSWGRFNGVGTPAIVAGHNFASITDNGTGDYTINFTTAFSSGLLYTMVVTKINTTSNLGCSASVYDVGNMAAGSCRIYSWENVGAADSPMFFAAFGDQ